MVRVVDRLSPLLGETGLAINRLDDAYCLSVTESEVWLERSF